MQEQLGLEGMPDKLIRVTPARLALWQACPRKYRMIYLDRPAPSRSGPWAHATLGAVVHNALRAFFDLRADQRTPEQAMTLLRRCWKSDGFFDAAQAAEYRQRCEQWLSDYVARLDPETTPIAVERWVSTQAGSIIAEGRVDRIDQRGDELVVVDYKTGRSALSVDSARNSLALALYALATRKTMRGTCRRVELHHLPTGQVFGWEHTEQTMDEHLQHAQRLATELQEATDALDNGMDADTAFPARPGRHCSWCEVRAHCPEGQRAAVAIPPWALLDDQSTVKA